MTTIATGLDFDASRPEATVIVCTCNRPDKLAVCLDALDRQTIRDRIEVIVVDDGPDDRAAEETLRYPSVRLVRHPRNLGLSTARNTGLRAATGPVVAFTDDDCVPSPEWVEQLLARYGEADAEGDASVLGVGGPVAALRHTTIVHRYLAETNRLAPLESELGSSSSIAYRAKLYIRQNITAGSIRPNRRQVYSLVGANMSFRRAALDAIGGFDDRIDFGGEDEDICRRLRDRWPCGRFEFTADAPILHDFEGTVRDALRRSYRYGVGGARSYLKNESQNPTLFPLPVAIVVLTTIGIRRPWARLLAVAAPLFVFTRWPIDAVRTGRPELLVFAHLQALEETAHDLGFASGWLRLRHAYRRSADATSNLEHIAEDVPIDAFTEARETVA